MVARPLSPATLTWLASPRPFHINGLAVAEGALHGLTNPATGKVFAQVHSADPAQVDLAVTAAREAFDDGRWRALNAAQRARIMWRLADLVEAHADELAELETLCMGKPYVAASKMEVPFFAETFRYFAGWCTKITGMNAPLSFPAGDMHGLTLQEPLGVVGMILPWNGPLVIAGWKVAPALAAGCTCVIKPADITPLSLLRFVELAEQAGVPAGVINVVTGSGSVTGAAIAAHPGIDKLAFTGSTGVGRQLVYAAAKSNLKKLSLELGGKSPVVVFADADLDAAVAGAADAIFGNSGQVCVAGSRLYVENAIRPEFTRRLIAKAQSLRLGDPFDPATDLGPLASAEHCAAVAGHVARGVAAGARLLCGGTADGCFFAPTILDVDDAQNPLVQQEVFGPVLCLSGFDSEDQAIALANGTAYGLAASVWTRDIDRALRLTRRLHCGIVWINTHNIPDLNMPIGGYGQSGWGRELGQLGLGEYLQTKSVMIRIAAPSQGTSA